MAISLRISKEDEALFKEYAKMNNISVSELIRQSVISRIQNQIDIKEYQKALEKYSNQEKAYALDEIMKD